jgi:hypothetical protein
MFRKSIEGLRSARGRKQYRNAIVRPLSLGCSRFAIAVRLVTALSVAWPLAAFGGLYKCLRDDGTVMYQEDPCPAGKELRDFERDPATVSVVPFDLSPPAAGAPAASGVRKDAAKAGGASSRAPTERQSGASGRASSKPAERSGNPAERKFLMPGIGEGEVVARIGRPDMSTGAGRKTVRWTYLPAPQDPQTITTLTFELGRLIQVERKIVRTP